MEIGRKGFSERELQEFYPKVYRRLHGHKKIAKAKPAKPVKALALRKALPTPAAPVGLPKPKRAAPKKAQKAAERALKKDERLGKNNSKLLEQLTFLNQRIETMERDKELYALVDTKAEEGTGYSFTVLRIGDEECPLKLEVNERFEMSCSCMDWRIRCRSLSVPCKHIYYLLVKILTYELYDYYDNQIMDPEGFKYLVRRRISTGGVNFEATLREELGEEVCAICYSKCEENVGGFGVLECPDCKHHMHRACVNAWMKHSPKRNCVYCKSEKWNMYFGYQQK